MRRLLGCFVVSSWLLACGGDDGSLFETGGGAGNAGAAGTMKIDSGQHADSGSSHAGGASGASGADSGIGTDSAVAPDVSVAGDAGPEGSAGSGGATGNDASDVSVVPYDASYGGGDASDTGVSDSPADGTNADAPYCAVDAAPPSDDNPCTTDGCSGGIPTHTPVGIGTPCSGGYCDALSKCAQCLAPSDCGPATFCAARSCNNEVCGVVYTAVNTPLPTQTTGDCKLKVCDASGGTKDNVDDTDKPDDSNPCTDDTCSSGTPGHTVLVGHACGASGVCNAEGNCVGCNSPSDCSGTDDFCKTRTCNNNVCGFSYTAPDTKLPDNQQTAKDCKKKVCDVSGNIQTVADGTDLPVDANDCTIDQCSGSTPQNLSADPGTPCSSGVCDGAGACVQCLSPANCPATGNVCTKPACDNNHHCAIENSTPDTSCGAGPSCAAGQGHLQDKCSSGACVPGSTVPCSPYICGTTACKTGCSGDSDCAVGTCDTGLSVCTTGPKCTDYCNDVMSACTGSYAQYFSMDACLKSCATLPRGTLGDSANTVGCRITHAGYAVSSPALHCPHAGPGGAGGCGANCEGFCTIAQATCKAPNPAIFPDLGSCMTACAGYADTPVYNASITSGNSFACRMYHLTAAVSLDAVFHCPHIQPVSATCQ